MWWRKKGGIPIIRSRKLYIPANPEGRNKEKSNQVYIYAQSAKRNLLAAPKTADI